MRNNNINEAIFQPKSSDSNKDEIKENGTIAYTLLGKEIDENNELAYAKKTTFSNRTKYFIKSNAYGFLNPFDLYGVKPNKEYQGKKEWEFSEVTNKVFEYYMKFLTTRNKIWLNHAEREDI